MSRPAVRRGQLQWAPSSAVLQVKYLHQEDDIAEVCLFDPPRFMGADKLASSIRNCYDCGNR